MSKVERSARSRCHPLFQDHDILCLILSCFDNEATPIRDVIFSNTRTRHTNSRHLASAALVSKSFFHPAIRILWRRLHSIIPLLRLIPSFVLINNSYTINDVISSQVQHRVLNYSKHLQYLVLSRYSNTETIQGHIIHRLLSFQDILFPNLLGLILTGPFYQSDTGHQTLDIDKTFLALSKSLTTLYITDIEISQTDYIASILSVLDQKQVQLQEVHLQGHLANSALTLLTCFQTLKTLIWSQYPTTLKMSTFISFANFPNLVELKITFDTDTDIDTDTQGYLRSANFSVLRSLTLTAATSSSTLNMLQCINDSKTLTKINIWTIDLEEVYTSDHSELLTMIAVVSECVRISHSSLRDFEMKAEGLYDIPGTFIVPLSKCRYLQTLRIENPVDADLHDATIRKVCERGCWKDLRILALPHTLSAASLKVIAENCPSLQELDIYVDFLLLDGNELQKTREGNRLDHHLKKLHLVTRSGSYSTITRDMEIAIGLSRLLDHCFTGLQDILIVSAGRDGAVDDWWHEVIVRLYSEFKCIRAEEQSCE